MSPDVGVPAQIRALLALRVGTLRGHARVRPAIGLATGLILFTAVPVTAAMLPRDRVGDFAALLPSAWTAFSLSTAVAIASGAGGRQLISRDQSLAFPVSPAADHCGALLLTPLNLSWLVQAMGLLSVTAWAVGPRAGLALSMLLTVAWIVASTVLGQAVGWLVELLRTTRSGVILLRAALAATLLTIGAVALTGRVTAVLDQLPTTRVVIAVFQASQGRLGRWTVDLAGLTVVTAISWWIGARLLAVLQRRPTLLQTRAESRTYRRRATTRTALAASLRIDHAGVWRSTPLRRGIATLVVIPGAAIAASGLGWHLVPLLPGLVAAGAGLLFGVNALALDGPGALWRDTLPVDPRLHLSARLLVIAETCLAGAGLVAVIGALAAPDRPTGADLAALFGAVVATSAHVLARCAVWSVHRPYAAGLRESRDQPAPPAAMAGYAARLAVSTTLLGLVFSGLAAIGSVTAVLLVAVGTLLVAVRSVLAVMRQWDDLTIRSAVLATVSGS